MCGIIGYIGSRSTSTVLIDGLKRLEYRGYDSAGMAVATEGGPLAIRKAVGSVKFLESAVSAHPADGFSGIAHTRWATHGAPTIPNAHPHVSSDETIAVVHNGIIENAGAIRRQLESRGVIFRSETDTETLAHLIQFHWDKNDTMASAVTAALKHVEGAYGLAVMSTRVPGQIVATRRGSPLLVALGDSEQFVASDPSAVLAYSRQVIYLSDGDVAILTAGGIIIQDASAVRVQRTVSVIDWDLAAIEKNGYPHFMLKEIMEQPATLLQTMRGRMPPGAAFPHLGGLMLTDEQIQAITRVIITACGTSFHAGHIGKQLIERYAHLPVSVEYASEFRYGSPVVDAHTLCIAISQSGETADTLAALREASRLGAMTLGVVNGVGSTISRETDTGMYCHAGPEIGVASTKAFTSQCVALTMLALRLGQARGLATGVALDVMDALRQIPTQAAEVLDQVHRQCEQIGIQLAASDHAIYLGRGFNYATALEGALKLKEISYIHAEGYAAAEMKHGPIALIDEEMPVIVIAPHDGLFDKLVGNIREIKARGGRVIALTNRDEPELAGWIDHDIRLPVTMDCLTPILASIPLQLIAYYAATARGTNVDQPRNLAKSVTVE